MGLVSKYRIRGRLLTITLWWCTALMAPNNLWGQEDLQNTADLYRTYAPLQCTFHSSLVEDSITLAVRLIFTEAPADSLTLDLTINHQDETSSTSQLSLSQAIHSTSKYYVFKWVYHRDAAPRSISLRVFVHPRAWIFRYALLTFLQHPNGGISYTVNRQPQFDGYLHPQDSLRLDHANDTTIFAYYYQHNFLPARPPMTLKAQQKGEALTIDSIIPLPVNKNVSLAQPGLYFMQADTNGIAGVSVLVTSRRFPKPTRIDDLTEPLVYLTTKEEYQSIKQDLTDKKALDRFWLTTIGDAQRARKSIKRFYKLVAEANALFSSYKEGWKTDRGMIYIVMGPPDVVLLNGNKEIWKYGQNTGFTVQFTFQHVSNLFSVNHYELVRDQSLGRTWFTAIDRWRKGLIDF